jgi:hypothetical protein
MAKIVTYNTLVRVGRAILTEAQNENKNSISSLVGEFQGYVNGQEQLNNTLSSGDFYISDSIFTFMYDDSVLAISKDSIIIAAVNNPHRDNREDWIIIKSTIVTELMDLKEIISNHINNKNNPHEVTLIQTNGEDINDSTFSNLLSEL